MMFIKSNQFLKSLFWGIALVFILSLASGAPASEQQDTGNYENLDERWLPWLGSWQLISNKINNINVSPSKDEYLVTISPGSNENSIIMKGYRGDEGLVEEEMIADNLRHQLADEKCSGYYIYSWSETGKRLLLNSESNCPGESPRRISGMSIIDDNRDWLDIQLLQNGAEKAVSIRKYRNIDSDTVTSGRFKPSKVNISRIAAGKNFTISEIIELNSKVEPEVLEAALLEIRKPFPINSKQLIKLSDYGVNSRIMDLMVAFTFPEKFTVEQETIYMVKGTEAPSIYPYCYYPYGCPIWPWHWASYCYPYGYYYLGWYYPIWPPSFPPGGGGGGVSNSGRLIKGHGYTIVDSDSSASSRRAQPRYVPAGQRAPVQSSSSSSSGGSSSVYTGGSSGGSVTTAPSGGYPSASPQGYSSGRR